MTVTQEQAQMIATLAIAARPHGARRWDASGVMAALAKVRGLELADVMMAAGRAARDRDIETPGALGNLNAPCWIERPVERFQPEKVGPTERCGVCGKSQAVCTSTPRFADDEHDFEPDFKDKRGDDVIEIVSAVKAELAPMREPAHAEDAAIVQGAGRARLALQPHNDHQEDQ